MNMNSTSKEKAKSPNENLNKLFYTKDKNVFIGINYETSMPLLEEIKKTIIDLEMNPIVPLDFSFPTDEIHDVSMWLLHQCKYAIFDISHPAGQLMELERSLDYPLSTFICYGSAHTSVMPLTLMKMMWKWQRGELFKYDSSTALQKFIKVALIRHSEKPDYDNHDKKFRSLINQTIEETNNIYLIFPMGTLKKKLEEKDIETINGFLGVKILITGWDEQSIKQKISKIFPDGIRGNKDKWYIVAEHCILKQLNPKEKEIHFENVNEMKYNDIEVNYIKICNKFLIESILGYEKLLGKIYFMSQGNKEGICYYLNPPQNIREELDKLTPNDNEKYIDEPLKVLKDEYGLCGEKVGETIKFPFKKETEDEILYLIAKFNGDKRPFLPYTMEKDKNYISLTLKYDKIENNGLDIEFIFDDIKKIVQGALMKIDAEYSQTNKEICTELLKRFQPQEDKAIDIFRKTKEEALGDILSNVIENVKKSENAKPNKENKTKPLIIYISSGRETDIPLILEGYNLSYNFVAVGPQGVSERLKNAGVLPLGDSLPEVIDYLNNLLN